MEFTGVWIVVQFPPSPNPISLNYNDLQSAYTPSVSRL